MLTKERLIERAQEGQRESKSLEFKSSFNPQSREDWCELLKDLVSLANSGGGVIVFGVQDNGMRSRFDPSTILDIDAADIVNKFESYTGYSYSDFEVIEVERDGVRHAAILLFPTDVPLVFIQHGAHIAAGRERRPAFAKGTVYFRHGAKSEPCTRDDIVAWHLRELEKVREEWLGGIRQVVEAPAGHTVRVVPRDAPDAGIMNARIVSNDPNAVAVRPENPEEIWPYRESEVIRRVQDALPAGIRFNQHDIRCLKLLHNISPGTRYDFVFKPHRNSSPQYSEAFIEWILAQFRANDRAFTEARDYLRAQQR